jgi:hypothetical protein
MRSIVRLAFALAVIPAVAPFIVSEAAAQVPTAEARPFIADWNLALEGDMPATIRVNITDNAGTVAAVVTGIEGRDTPVTTITKAGENLVLSYNTSIQGQAVPIRITLTPEGENLKGNLDLAGGMMTMPGTATKR